MDTFHDTTSPVSPATRTAHAPSSTAPTPAELANWKAEAGQFLDDMQRRLDDILSQLDDRLRDAPQTDPQTSQFRADAAPPLPGESASCPAAQSGEDRFSALKAQLARKLHNLDESHRGPFAGDAGVEARS